MAQPPKPGTAQRAYTLKLDGIKPDDNSWRERLWTTHEKVNLGAHAFGDFLLTLRGGVKPPSGTEKPEQRRLLALCWFSVESEDEATKIFRVEHNDDKQVGRRADWPAMRKALLDCLEAKSVPASERDEWAKDCENALKARIRDDSVWVQRWKAFENLSSNRPQSQEISNILTKILGKDWLAPKALEKKRKKKPSSDKPDDDADHDEGAGASRPSKGDEKVAGRARNAGRQLACDLFGKGKKKDYEARIEFLLRLIQFAEGMTNSPPKNADDLKARVLDFRLGAKLPSAQPEWEGKDRAKRLVAVREPALADKRILKVWQDALSAVSAHSKTEQPDSNAGRFLEAKTWKELKKRSETQFESDESKRNRSLGTPWAQSLLKRIESELGMQYADDSGDKANTQFFYLMFGFAASALSKTHSWMRRAEAARSVAAEKSESLKKKFTKDDEYEAASNWLSGWLDERSLSSNARTSIHLRKEAIAGWEDLLKQWKGLSSTDERKHAVEELQAATEEKFGWADLFYALAEEDAKCVWQVNDRAKPEILKEFVAWQKAQYDTQRYKVPSYRHPDPFEHPFFCEFGNSKPDVEYAWQKNPDERDPAKISEMTLLLLDKSSQTKNTPLVWMSQRLCKEFGFSDRGLEKLAALSRNTRLGRAASASFPTGNLDPKAPSWIFRPVKGSKKADDTQKDKPKKWNARLQVNREELSRLGRLWKNDKDKARKELGNLKWFATFSSNLACNGPWWDFIKTPEIAGIVNQPYQEDSRSPVLYFYKEKRWKERLDKGWMVRPGLGVLPGIRVLGVDIGHRYGAIGAIWQQVSNEEVRLAAKTAGVKPPTETDVSFCCDDPTRPACKEGSRKGKLPRLVFRRTGPEQWARLERQFPIRLEGELGDVRPIHDWEKNWLTEFFEELGHKPEDDQDKSPSVSDARLDAILASGRALARHGDRARIAHYLVAPAIPGMGGQLRPIKTAEDRRPMWKRH